MRTKYRMSRAEVVAAVFLKLLLGSFAASIRILIEGISLNNHCEKFHGKPIIALGVILMIVSLAGLIGSARRLDWLRCVFLLLMFLLFVSLFCFAIFAFVVTSKGAGKVVSGRGYKEYRLGDYSNWLQNWVSSNKNWKEIKSCLQDRKVCKSLVDSNSPQADFYSSHLSPIQSGCCKPPTSCGFTYVSATNWTKPTEFDSTNVDCATWSNDPTLLCYDCQSCKAGVLANLKHEWRKVAPWDIFFTILFIIVFFVGCDVFENFPVKNFYE